MARADAVRAVNPALFDRGWSKVSGSASGGIGRRAQMVRAARGHAPAIFKPIRQGGCHTGAQLRSQLTYLTTKSSFILDSRGTHDGKKVLSPAEIERVARRFENQWNERHSPKLGHTSHLLMAFPVGTRTSEVREITREICERFFEGDGAQFDYIAAIHEDRAHPHAHIVLNRRSKDGEMFFLGKDHHFNYDVFREAMVEAAERHGLRLEATRRLDRGVLTRAASDVEIRKAEQEGRAPVERLRTGADLDHAIAEVARNAAIYRGLAAEASRSNFHDVAEALSRAGDVLARGNRIQSDGVLYMTDEVHDFDQLIDRFSQNIRQIEGLIERASATERPVIERKLTDVLREVSHLQPLGERSDTLHEPASRDGIYAAPNLVEAHRDQLDHPDLKARVAEAMRGTGIDSDAVIARMREGAGNAALEQQWLAQDLRAIAKEEQLDLRDTAQRDQAMDRLEAVHGKLGDVLTEARVLRAVEEVEREGPEREEGARRSEISAHRVSADNVAARSEPDIFDPAERQEFRALVSQFTRTDFSYPYSDDPRARRDGEKQVAEAKEAFDRFAERSPQHAELATMAWEKATDVMQSPATGVRAAHRTLHAGDMDLAQRDPSIRLGPITEEVREMARFRAETPQDQIRDAVSREINQLHAEGASRAQISEKIAEVEDSARQAHAERRSLDVTAPQLASALRQAADGKVDLASDTAQQRFVEQVNDRLTPAEINDLHRGDAKVLDRITPNALEQLQLARAYLEAKEVHANDPAMDRVLERIVEERHGEDLRHSLSHGEKGITHG
ncbi:MULTISPECIES: relaxase/mobilization nuclease domain-containing protein [Haematobacter]|uniref:Endonuclease n=3 Tax=Haematobacter TaxID=366614 RepID=A0A086XTN9_9RHOB|nr:MULTISPECIES: relaxase/mobilization nuclease domain-containing protein [Haematobacter]KFI25389.1 endonuclease [Haematobacter massiliensis]OWJ74889.1 endonuclease [Haematobacter genomosp. 1]OWJ81002.1 endonuclease [Haematobacter missouriensis]OWJ81393.1 endonuclease [Haematobacter massiliensis]